MARRPQLENCSHPEGIGNSGHRFLKEGVETFIGFIVSDWGEGLRGLDPSFRVIVASVDTALFLNQLLMEVCESDEYEKPRIMISVTRIRLDVL